MDKKKPEEEEDIQIIRATNFGYIPSIIFLVFMAFVIYIAVTK